MFDVSCLCAIFLLRSCLSFKYISLVGKETTSEDDDVEGELVVNDAPAPPPAAPPVVCVVVDGDAVLPRFDSLLVVVPKNEDTC